MLGKGGLKPCDSENSQSHLISLELNNTWKKAIKTVWDGVCKHSFQFILFLFPNRVPKDNTRGSEIKQLIKKKRLLFLKICKVNVFTLGLLSSECMQSTEKGLTCLNMLRKTRWLNFHGHTITFTDLSFYACVYLCLYNLIFSVYDGLYFLKIKDKTQLWEHPLVPLKQVSFRKVGNTTYNKNKLSTKQKILKVLVCLCKLAT